MAEASSLASPQERYLYKPFIGSSHHWAISRCQTLEKERAVLDIGSGSGAIGRALGEMGYSRLDAVEIDPRAREHVRDIYGSVEESIAAYAGRKYGLMLMLDVLEHMTDPAAFLSQAVDLLEPGAVALISVPNVTHWSVRIPFMFGRFDYADRGILDRTHFRFFTRKAFRRLLAAQASLAVEEICSSIEPAEFVLPQAIWDNEIFRTCSRLRVAAANLMPGLMAYQHLALLRKRSA